MKNIYTENVFYKRDEMNNKFKIEGYDSLAKDIFKDIYPLIAKQILDRTRIENGICIDIGSGGGYLGIEIAKLTNMTVYLLDNNEDTRKFAEERILKENLGDRVFFFSGDVHDLNFNDNFFDLVISRSSYTFWKDKNKALNEIYRVLRNNGKAYIGKGYGSKKLKEEIEKKMFIINPKKWYPDKKEIRLSEFKKDFEFFIEENNIIKHEFIDNESGKWIIFEK